MANTIEKLKFSMIQNYILTGLPMMGCNPGAVAEVWALLDQYGYEIRYQMYEDWFSSLVANSLTKKVMTPRLLYNLGEYVSQAKHFLKNISDKDVDKNNSRSFSKICHNAPCIVLNEVVKQLRIYNNIIPSVSASLANYSLPLSIEVSIFMILRHLSEIGKGIIREEEGLIESWMQNCSNFISLTVKKHHKTDLTGIFVFISNRLALDSDKESVFILLFRDILTRMSGYESIQLFTEAQLGALSGGIALKTEAFGLSEQVRAAKKSSKSLADFLWSKENYVRVYGDNDEEYVLSVPVYLMILMSRNRDKLMFKPNLTKPTLINMLYDMINDSLVQFGLFLSYHSDSYQSYGQLLPSEPWRVLTDLKVSPEISYQILRHSFKPLYKLEEAEWTDLVSRFKTSFEDFHGRSNFVQAFGEEEDKLTLHVETDRGRTWADDVSRAIYSLLAARV